MHFSQGFVSTLIIVSLITISVSVVTLLVFLIKDIRNKKLW